MAGSTRTLTAVLRLRDQMSGKVRGAIKQLEKMRGATKRVADSTRQVERVAQATGNTTTSVFTRMRQVASRAGQSVSQAFSRVGEAAKKADERMKRMADTPGLLISRFTALIASLGLVAGAITGLNATIGGAMEIEQEKIAMEHFIKLQNPDADTKKLTEDMVAWLRRNAQQTPFATGEVLAAGRRALNVASGDIEMAKELVVLAENMAALNPGKTVMDAMEALADLRVGETERMKEFGFKITQEQLKEYGGGDVVAGALQMMRTDIAKMFEGGAEKLSQSGRGKLNVITGGIESALQDMGTKALDKLKPVLDRIGEFIDSEKFNQLIEKGSDLLATAVERLIEFGDRLIDIIRKVNEFAVSLGGWKNIITGVVATFGVFQAALLLGKAYLLGVGLAAKIAAGGIAAVISPVLMIAAAIAAATALIYFAWTRNWWGIREKTQAVIEWLKPYIQQAIQFVLAIWNKLAAYAQEIWPYIQQIIQGVWSVLGPLVQFWVTYMATTIRIAFLTAWDVVKLVMGAIWNIIKTVWTLVSGVFKAFLQFITGDFSGAWQTLRETVGQVFEMIGTTITEFVQGALDVGRRFIDNIIEGFLSVWGKLRETASKIWDSITDIFSRKKTVDVVLNAEGGGEAAGARPARSHASGLDYVPYDGYVARLHKGERVLTPEEAKNYGAPPVINISGNTFIVREEADIEKIARRLAEMIMGEGGLVAHA